MPLDPRPDEPERPDLARGGRGGSDDFGKSKEPFWQQAYTDLLKFVILLRRLTEATRIEADFTGTDCQQATFIGRVVLTKN